MIWILNENLKIIKILHKYTMAQFVDKGRDIGTVTINAVFCDENLYLLDKNVTYYVLYKPKNTREILAKIEKAEKQDEEDADFADTIKLTGRFIISWFEKRVLKGTYKADNIKANKFIEDLVEDCYKISDRYRGIKIAVLQDNISQEMIQSVTKEVTGGTLFDLTKLNFISKLYFSRLTATELYQMILPYYKEYDPSFYQLLIQYPKESIAILNVEREIKKPRKDFASFSDV